MAYHFILIVLGNIFTPFIINVCKRRHITRTSKPYVFMQIIKTSILVVFGELFFRAEFKKVCCRSKHIGIEGVYR